MKYITDKLGPIGEADGDVVGQGCGGGVLMERRMGGGDSEDEGQAEAEAEGTVRGREPNEQEAGVTITQMPQGEATSNS